MEAQTSTSELTVSAENYIEKAWHLAAVLLSIGRPSSLAELSAKCSLFTASIELVEFLCFVPNSPIYLDRNDVVLLSASAFRAVGEFFAVTVPRVRIGSIGVAMCGNRYGAGEVVRTYFRKRKNFGSEFFPVVKKRAILSSIEGNEKEKESVGSDRKIVLGLRALPLDDMHDMPKETTLEYFSDKAVTRSMTISNPRLLEYQLENDDYQKCESKLETSQKEDILDSLVVERHLDKYYNDDVTILSTSEVQGEGCGTLLFRSLAEIAAFLEVDEPEPIDLKPNMDMDFSSCMDPIQHDKDSIVDAIVALSPHDDFINRQAPETKIEDMVELPVENFTCPDRNPEKEKHSLNICVLGLENPSQTQPTLAEDTANNEANNLALVPANPQFSNQETFSKLSAVQKKVPQLKSSLKHKASTKLQQDSKVDILHKKTRGQKDQNATALRDTGKHVDRDSAAVDEKCANKSVKVQQDSNYPIFEAYTVEEEEGSGGYGTVYRARRKTDGVAFAIKCPHPNAHVHHLKNELKMLQRFGGKNFVIKYEGSLKSGKAECFVLEHVEHDRPEALKREIDISQLQWYGFCLFKALTSLHRQGVFHRDVKPGNFLFSCKTEKGYLIDFNLAKDLHQKPESLDKKSQPGHMSASEPVLAPKHTFATSSKRRKILSGKPSDALNPEATNLTNHTLESRTVKSKTMGRIKAYGDLGRANSLTSQGADGSALTSKDLTNTRTSGDKLREPVPCQGRKELINLAQKAMQFPNHGAGSTLISKRKRVVASPIVIDQKFIHPTPTPLHSSGGAVLGAGSLNRGDPKSNKEGPCVGTKGFRAPEVLLRSSFQGPKIDVWSAGVTLLYLITGKMPFTGDPEQNMKEIVKMKGNEELWEVAKLHNRESSISVELLDVKFLQTMTIKEWCVANTKRTRFLEAIPSSLFDLIEKCLIVNPRMRITAEEAFRHDFFAPCHDTLHRIKLRKLSQQHRQPSSSSSSPPVLPEPVGTDIQILV